jgi:hypothetical protein
MSRNDYILIARIIASLRPALKPEAHYITAKAFAGQLSGQSKAFDYDRFLSACAIGTTVEVADNRWNPAE